MGRGGVTASAKHLGLHVKQPVVEALVLSSRAWSLVHPSPPGNEKHKLQVCLCIYAERCVSGAPGTRRPLKPCTPPQNGCQMCWLYWIPRSLTPQMLRLLPVWFLLCSSFSLPGTVLQDRVWPWMAAVPAEALCWHAGALGARLAGTLFKQRKRVCFYSSSLGAWAGILCHFPVLGARFWRKAAPSLCCKAQLLPANKYASYPLWLVSAGDFVKLNLDLVWYLSVGAINSIKTPEVNRRLAACARGASWAGLASSLLVRPQYCSPSRIPSQWEVELPGPAIVHLSECSAQESRLAMQLSLASVGRTFKSIS